MIALLAFAGTICLVGWLAVHQITVASLHRAVRRGQIDPRPGTVVRPVRLAALGHRDGGPHAAGRWRDGCVDARW